MTHNLRIKWPDQHGRDDMEVWLDTCSEVRKEPNESAWLDSPFLWLKRLDPRTRGVCIEDVTERWLFKLGYAIDRVRDGADRLIDGVRIEIKSSLVQEDGSYEFQQIRDQDYAALLCIGISPPATVNCWCVPRQVVMKFWRIGVIGSRTHAGGRQRTRRRGRKRPRVDGDTGFIRLRPEEPGWLREWGGTLAEGRAELDRLLKGDSP